MKIEPPPIDLKLPVPSGAELRPLTEHRSSKAPAAYEATHVIDTIEIKHNDCQTVPIYAKSTLDDLGGSRKGLYIDLWI